jgi:hypothetical protein
MMKNAMDVGITRLWKAATFLRHLEGANSIWKCNDFQS